VSVTAEFLIVFECKRNFSIRGLHWLFSLVSKLFVGRFRWFVGDSCLLHDYFPLLHRNLLLFNWKLVVERNTLTVLAERLSLWKTLIRCCHSSSILIRGLCVIMLSRILTCGTLTHTNPSEWGTGTTILYHALAMLICSFRWYLTGKDELRIPISYCRVT
jgi:hypothetical protein